MNCTPIMHGERIVCQRCKRLFPRGSTLESLAECKAPPCVHLGGKRGTVKVSCGNGCARLHRVRECDVHGRCLQNFKGPWDSDHQLEAALYHLCHGCGDYSPNPDTPPNAES